MMKRRGITFFRWICLIISFFFLVYGGNFVSTKIDWVKLPVFSCALSPSGSVNSVCKTIVDIDDWTFTNSMGVTLIGIGIFVLLIILLGRFLCGYVCPFGFIQEIVGTVRKKIKLPSLKVSSKLKPYFIILKWIMVIGFLFGIGYCELCPIRYIMLPLAGMVSETHLLGVIFAAIIIGLAFFKERIFCKICPIGTIAGVFNKHCFARIKKNGTACTHCRVCIEVCPMDIQEIYEEREQNDLTKQDCIYCMKCIEACPEKDALWFELGGKKILKSKRKTR